MPPEFQDYVALHDTIVRNNRTFYENTGGLNQLKAMMFVVCNNGDIYHTYTDCRDEADRVSFCDQLRAQFVQWDVSHYCWTGEAWCASGDTGRSPAARADRVEIVYVNAMSRDGLAKLSVFELVRDWQTGRVTTMQERLDLNIDVSTSEFSHLFP